MAIDYGTKAVGIAISDELQLTARPLTTLRRKNLPRTALLETIGSLVLEHEVGVLAVGLPLRMDGSRGDAAAVVEKFAADLRGRLSILIIMIDERLTSHEADQIMRERGVGAAERRARSDEFAAMIILQDYLDAQSRTNNQSGSGKV
jgi:putative holliday junction resolvase